MSAQKLAKWRTQLSGRNLTVGTETEKRRLNGLKTASIAMAEAVINLVPDCPEQDKALENIDAMLINILDGIKKNPLKEEEQPFPSRTRKEFYGR